MGVDRSRANLRGVLIPSARIKTATIDAALSSYTEAGGRVAITSSPSPRSDLTLCALGAAPSSPIELRTLVGGYPGRGPGSGGFGWRRAGDDDWIGMDPPHLRGWDGVVVRASGGTQEDAHPSVIGLRVGTNAGTFLLATSRKAGAAYRIDVYGRYGSQSGQSWALLATAATDGIAGHNWPALVELPSGRVLLYYWVDSGAGLHQIRARCSDDGGATWSLYSRWCLEADLDLDGADPEVIAAAYSGGEVALVCSSDGWLGLSGAAGDQRGGQYASSDDGTTFAVVSDHAELTTNASWGWALLPVPSGFLLVWSELDIAGPSSNYAVHAELLGSAYQPYRSDGTVVLEPSGLLPIVTSSLTGRAAPWLDDDGTMWIAGTWTDAGLSERYLTLLRSRDGGITWDDPASISESSPTYYAADLSAASVGGRAVLAHGWAGGPNAGVSVGSLWLGGWASWTLRSAAPDPMDAELPDIAWAGFVSPSDLAAWGETRTGAPTDAAGDHGVEVDCAIGEGLVWDRSLSASAQYIRVTARVGCSLGGSTTTRSVYLAVDVSNGVDSQYSVEVFVSAAGIRARDAVAGTSLALLTSSWVLGGDIRIEVTQAGQAVVSYLQREALADGGTHGAPVRRWAVLYSGAVTQKTSSVRAYSRIEFGTADTTPVATVALWSHLELVASETLHQLPATTDDQLPGHLAVDPVELEDGVFVAARLGPAARDEEWTIGAEYQHGVTRLDPREHPSPRAGWRSVGTSEQQIAWGISGESGVRGLIGGHLLGLHLEGINWRTGRLEAYDGAGWETLVEIDTAADGGNSGLPFVRRGNGVRVDTGGSGSASRAWRLGEHVGATVELVGGTTGLYRCTESGAGWWDPDATTQRPELRIAASSGADPASGSMAVWSRRWTGVVALDFEYSALRLVIDSQDTLDGDLRIGALVMGPVVVVPDWGWGRSTDHAAGVDLTTRRDGSRTAVRRAPVRRSMSVSWSEGRILGATSADVVEAPDYVTADSFIVGLPEDLRTLAGLLEVLDGSKTPCVLLPVVPRAAASAWTHPDGSMYARLVSKVTTEEAGGTDARQHLRVLAATFEEEL